MIEPRSRVSARSWREGAGASRRVSEQSPGEALLVQELGLYPESCHPRNSRRHVADWGAGITKTADTGRQQVFRLTCADIKFKVSKRL